MGLLLVFIASILIWGAYGFPEPPPTPLTFPFPAYDVMGGGKLYDTEENTTPIVISNKSPCNSKNDANDKRFTLHEKTLNWFHAMITCWSEGQQLAVPRSPQEAKALASNLFKTKSLPGEVNSDALHVGIHDIDQDNVWRTLDGYLLSEAGYDLWLAGGEGPCGALFADGRYVRQPCSTRMRFACEKTRSEAASRKATDYIQLGDAGRFRLYQEPLPWALALQNCEAEGATLAVPANARQAGLLAGVMVTGAPHNSALREHGFFVGITDVAQEGIWRTVQGDATSSAGYDQWAPSQPSHSRTKNCGVLQKDGRYGEHSCMEPLAYCCQEIETPRDSEENVVVKGRFHLHKKPLSWFEALQACQRENATFMSVTDRELTHVKELMMKASETIYNRHYETVPSLGSIHVSIYDFNGNNTWRRIYVDGNSKENYLTISTNNDYENSYEDQQSYGQKINVKRGREVSHNCVSLVYNDGYYSVGCDVPLPYVCKKK